jgi:hypothetical protein
MPSNPATAETGEVTMKAYDALTPAQQANALAYFTTRILEAILEQGLSFDDAVNDDNLQARIDAACKKAEGMHTPWFAHKYIMDTCKEDIESMAQCDAEDALYSEDETVVSLRAVEKAV